MILIGIDPGLAATGYGLVERQGPRYRWIEHGCIRTPANAPLEHRLLDIHTQVAELIQQHRPEVLVLERLYQLRDGSTGLAVGQAMGVVRLAAAQAALPVAEYTPTHVKMTLVGNGGAAKEQVQFMVQRLLGLPEPPRPDHAGDALALCICHLHSGLSRAGGEGGSAGLAQGRIAKALAAEEQRRAAHLERVDPS